MKHALIIAHPNPKSFTGTMASAYADALRDQGHEVLVRDLYEMDFDPRLRAEEIPGPHGFSPGADVADERARLQDIQAFAFFYPVWFNAPPAILKGFVDRVFGMGFGYGMGHGGNAPLLAGRTLISVSSSGSPKPWLIESGAWDAIRKLFDEHLGGVTGLAVLDHLHFGAITPDITGEAVESCAEQARAAAVRHFGRTAG